MDIDRLQAGLFWAAIRDPVAIAKLLADPTSKPNCQDNYPIRTAVMFGEEAVVELLLADRRVDPGDVDNCALFVAATHNFPGIVSKLLADPRVDPNSRYYAALQSAIEKRHHVIASMLIDRVDKRGLSVARESAIEYDNEVALELLNRNEIVKNNTCV